MLIKNKSVFAMILLIGFIFIDLYGMIDNTYYMFGFMTILVIGLAVFEKGIEAEIKKLSEETIMD